MIIREDTEIHDKSEVPNQQQEPPPPQYEENDSSTPGPVPVDSRAVNYISINKPLGSIDCTYLLDPSVHMPSYFLPKLEQGQSEKDRKNLSLKTKVGTINANIFLLHREGSVSTKRTTLECKTTVGTMVLTVDTTPSEKRPPFHLKASSQSGTVLIHLPRSFRGFLTITTTIGGVTLSPQVHQANRWINTAGRVRRGFLGDFSALGDVDIDSWSGDEVLIETTVGSVEVGFVGDHGASICGVSAVPPTATYSTSSSWHSSSSSYSYSTSSSSSSSSRYRNDSSSPSPFQHLENLAMRGRGSTGVVATRARGSPNSNASGGPPPLAALLGYHNHEKSGT